MNDTSAVSGLSALPIGVFDSGLGGLTVVRAIYEQLPGESTLYFGDTARVPYGPKSPDTVRRYSLEILRWLIGQRVKAVVVACNTSTAHALEALQQASPVPVIGVIEPGARAAVQAAGGRPIGVIGTAGTIASGAYERAIQKRAPGSHVVSRACPLLVPLVEEGWFERPATRLIAEEYLAPLRDAAVGSLVLGCTHYPLLKPLLQGVMGRDVRLIDSAAETARALASVLEREGLAAPEGGPASHHFAVTDDAPRFLAVGSRFLGDRLSEAEVVTWQEP
jgi:glutamate racemase